MTEKSTPQKGIKGKATPKKSSAGKRKKAMTATEAFAREKKQKHPYMVRFDKALFDRLQIARIVENRPMSEIVEDAVSEYLERAGTPQAPTLKKPKLSK